MPTDFDNQPLLSWEDYWAIIRRRRWWLGGSFFLGWVLLWSAGWLLPARYRSETLVLVEQQKVPERYVTPNVAADLQERLQSMTQQILSRTRLLRIIDDLNLYPQERAQLTPEELLERMRRDIKIEIVRGDRRSNELTAFRVFYSAPDPQLAQQVTSRLTSLFIEENLRVRQEQSESTTAFLGNQVEEARRELARQEERLREFKTRYLGELPEQLQGNVQILTGLQNRHQALMTALNQAEQQKLYLDSLARQYRSLQANLRQGSSREVSPPAVLEQELERLRSQLTDLSTRYTDRHPDVLQVKQQIEKTEKLKQEIEAEIASMAQDPTVEGEGPRPTNFAQLTVMSPVLQIESQRKASELEVQNRKREIQETEAQIRQYQSRLNLTPLREQQLADLTRDYRQSRENYDSLLAKKLQSELATNLEKRQQGEQFRILDPPSLPQKPYWPDRSRFSLIGLVAGMFLGILAVVGTEMWDDRIYQEKDFAGLLPVPVLAEIPPLLTPRERRRQSWRKRTEWITGVLLLLAVAAGNLAAFRWG